MRTKHAIRPVIRRDGSTELRLLIVGLNEENSLNGSTVVPAGLQHQSGEAAFMAGKGSSERALTASFPLNMVVAVSTWQDVVEKH